jgi:hypothetical protein
MAFRLFDPRQGSGGRGPQIGAEIEMGAPLAREPLGFQVVAQGRFARPCRTDQEQGFRFLLH